MALINETRSIRWYETCKCICRLNKLFVTISKNGMKKNVDVNVNN